MLCMYGGEYMYVSHTQVLLTLNTLALNMVSVVHNALQMFESMQQQLLGPEHARAQVYYLSLSFSRISRMTLAGVCSKRIGWPKLFVLLAGKWREGQANQPS